ncbi:LysR family transcriptional regulator [Catellatospora vulcania]|uniref:LysR family transcriptional regulator n=1 Tax=Catellatospora vulcania TaxID=1460450 RepID=UPI001E62B49E|nr:LysR family transcriptional regulator [Catellatospora vulcania]
MPRNADLNLLLPLQALLAERSVTRAAERLGLSQPATSAALAKLRRHFGDDLLIRVGNSYQLTPLAVQLYERVTTAVAATDRVFASEPDFDPATSDRQFTVLMSDYALSILGPAVSALLDTLAPKVRLYVQPTTRENVDAAHETLRTTDLLVLPHGFVTDLPHQDLYSDEWMCLVSADNPNVGDSLSLDQLAAMPWVLTYHRGTAFTTAAHELRRLGVELDVRMVAESYALLPAMIIGTRRVALVQRQLGLQLSTTGQVRAVPCPFEAAPLIEAMWWHPMHDSDAGHQWLRQRFAEAAHLVQH